MPKPEKITPSVSHSAEQGDLTEQDVRAWLEIFYAAQVVKVDIAKRLTNQASFWVI